MSDLVCLCTHLAPDCRRRPPASLVGLYSTPFRGIWLDSGQKCLCGGRACYLRLAFLYVRASLPGKRLRFGKKKALQFSKSHACCSRCASPSSCCFLFCF